MGSCGVVWVAPIIVVPLSLLIDRARELGTACNLPEGTAEGLYASSAAAILESWRGWRGRDNSETIGLTADGDVAEPFLKQEEGQPEQSFALGELDADQGRLRRRMRQQRAHAMQPLGQVSASGSKAMLSAALEGRMMLDILSGKRVAPWEGSAGFTHECVDGVSATAGLGEGGRSPWMGRSPPSGNMWKKIKA